MSTTNNAVVGRQLASFDIKSLPARQFASTGSNVSNSTQRVNYKNDRHTDSNWFDHASVIVGSAGFGFMMSY